MTMIYDKNEEKIIISVDKLNKIYGKNSLKMNFEVLFLSLSIWEIDLFSVNWCYK
jgi:hypothetical protein